MSPLAEVADERVSVAWAPSPIFMQATGGEQWNPDDEWIPFSAILAGTLAWYDTSARRWVTYPHRASSALPLQGEDGFGD